MILTISMQHKGMNLLDEKKQKRKTRRRATFVQEFGSSFSAGTLSIYFPYSICIGPIYTYEFSIM
ncbi:hypothetical protein HanIR_Chr04g0207561 [Helianthus annuus]|nr:hypothetical protein HanIR_Chr04g0207561 [Helianthus annuus]